MTELEAKDFLVQQTAKQAEIENVPLSDLEKRMMYFTETGEMRENPSELNDEFEAEYDSNDYEAKISKLMHHAKARIRKENPETARRWNEALRELKKGDHYILVLCGGEPRIGAGKLSSGSLKLFAPLIGGALLMILVAILMQHYGLGSGDRRGLPPRIQRSIPLWLQRTLWAGIIGTYVYFVILPWLLKDFSPGINQLLTRLLGVSKRNSRE